MLHLEWRHKVKRREFSIDRKLIRPTRQPSAKTLKIIIIDQGGKQGVLQRRRYIEFRANEGVLIRILTSAREAQDEDSFVRILYFSH